MIPADAPTDDWPLYYNHTLMRHSGLGICYITIRDNEDGRSLNAAPINNNGIPGGPIKADPKDLQIFFPRAGAYNIKDSRAAAFVGRRAQRMMKRSACTNHYYLIWGPAIHTNYFTWLAVCPPYFTIEEARTKFYLRGGNDWTSAAISAKVILERQHRTDKRTNLTVIYKGESIGELNPDSEFMPYCPEDSRLSRISKHLRMCGVNGLC